MAAMIFRLDYLFLLLLLIWLQFSLWSGEGSFAQYEKVSGQIAEQRQANRVLKNRNVALAAEVVALQQNEGSDASREVEGMARLELGMIRKGETFFYMPD